MANGVHDRRRCAGTGILRGLLALAVAVAAPRALRAQENWSWVLPGKIYQNLDFSERAGIDRALAVFRRAEEAEKRNTPVNDLIPLYRGAAAEWRKFQLQYEQTASPAIAAYSLFMQGLSLQGARDRHAAIKAYTELLDYFLDERWISSAALYHIGLAHLQNGDERQGLKVYATLVEDPEHAKHPLAARALNRLAAARWREKKSGEAGDYWRRVMTAHFKAVARNDYNESRDLYVQSLAVTGQWRAYEELLFEGIHPEAVQKRADAVQGAVEWLRNRMYHFWPGWYYAVYFAEKEREAKRAAWRKELATWFDSYQVLFAEADRVWNHAVLAFRVWHEYRAEEGAKRVPAINKLLLGLKTDDAGKAKYGWEFAIILWECNMVDEARATINTLLRGLKIDDAHKARIARDFAMTLCTRQLFGEARAMLPFVKNAVDNLWLTFEIENRANQLPAAQLALEGLVASQDPAVSLAGKKRLAWFHKDRTRNYEKAVALYLDIAQPPGTLWDLQECYRRWGKKREAYTVLTELASIFPAEAARAVWVQGQYREQDGEKDKAIACYRRLLSQPEW
ncbi:MAG: tetratricopeptide repeat protein, partial [Lentisphaerae bacterium]|nr:tetratricopeptide repeat protein [Lentisphaerota bacterium]